MKSKHLTYLLIIIFCSFLFLIRYAIQCDSNYSGNLIKKNLIITCNDQYSLTEKKLREIENIIYFNNIYLSNGPSLSDITQIKN